MKIRTKITWIQLTSVFCILLSVIMLYRSLMQIQSLKDLEVRINKFIILEYELQDRIYNLLYTQNRLVEYGSEIINLHEELEHELEITYELVMQNNFELQNNFKTFYYNWSQKDINYYTPLARRVKEFVSQEGLWVHALNSNGLLKGADNLEMYVSQSLIKQQELDIVRGVINLILKYKGSENNIERQINPVQDDLIYIIHSTIATYTLFVILIIIFAVSIAILMSNRISKDILAKVKNVEKSLETISEGDLSRQFIDRSGDEFSELTSNFNTLTNTLMDKTTSMRDIMTQVSDIISHDVNIEALLVNITKIAKQSTNADAAAILLVDKYSDNLMVEHFEGFYPPPYPVSNSVKTKRSLIEDKFKNTPIPFHSSYLAKDTLLKGEAFFIKDSELEKQAIPLNSNPRDVLFIKSVMVIPLVVSNKLLGVISLVNTNRDKVFSDLDFTNMESFMEYVSMTIDNLYKYLEVLEKSEMKREMNIASEIQTQLLPKKIPTINNADVSAFSQSARGISGDYYDIYKISQTKSVATVCDVAGKGIAAALVLVIIRTIMQLASNNKSTAKDLLTFLNKSISDRVKTDYFATLSVLVFDNETGEATLAIAGDTPVLVYRSKEDIVERINHNDVPVGIDNTTTYKNKKIVLNEDDVLYMFSDGLLEVRNDFDDIFSIDELESFILENSVNRTETISVLLKEYLNEFRGTRPRLDDETVIIFKKL